MIPRANTYTFLMFLVQLEPKTKEMQIKSLLKNQRKKRQKVKARSASAGIKVSECDADVFLTHSDAKLGKWWKD